MVKRKDLSMLSMGLLLLAAVILIISVHFPWWRMDFFAPQYPEGVDIIVCPDKVVGDIDIINNLNHYIGMKEFSTEEFTELAYLRYIAYTLAALTVIDALLRRNLYVYIYSIVFV